MSGAVPTGGTRPGRPPAGHVDPRGPRFAAAVTTVLLSLTLLTGSVWLLALVTALFGWTVVAGPGRGPWGMVFRHAIRPRLAPPQFWEDESGPRFAQLVGLLVGAVGLVLAVSGVPHAVPGAASIALVAAGLNAAYGICLGCWVYRVLLRLRRAAPAQ